MKNDHLERYLFLLNDYVNNGMNASEFECQFLEIHRTDPSDYSENTHRIISALFSDVDAYCADTNIRDVNDLDDLGLLEKAKIALSRLMKEVG